MAKKKRWTLLNYGSTVVLAFIDPAEDGALAYLEPDRASYRVEGCAEILQTARVIKSPRFTGKMAFFLSQVAPNAKLVRI